MASQTDHSDKLTREQMEAQVRRLWWGTEY